MACFQKLSCLIGLWLLVLPACGSHTAGAQECPGDDVGYTDTTTMLHDELYGTRDGNVEVIWPILGRGKLQ